MSTQRCRSEAIMATYAEWRYVRAMSLFLAVLVLAMLFLLLARPPLLLPLMSVILLICTAVAALAIWWTSCEWRPRAVKAESVSRLARSA